MKVISGNNVLVFVDGLPIYCALNCQFTEDKDTVESTGAVGTWTYNRLQKKSWKIDVTGLTKIDSSDGQEDHFTMISDPFAMGAQNITMTFDDGDGNIVTIIGVMYLTKSSISGPAVGFAKADVSFIGTGEYIVSTDASGSGGGSGGGCVPVGGGSFEPPDGLLGDAYSYTFPLTGTAPFSIDSETHPGWMNATIVGTDLVLGGTVPDDNNELGEGVPVSVTVSNDCGTEVFSNTIRVTEDGRNVFVINLTGDTLTIANGALHFYTYGAGVNGNFKMQDNNFFVTTMTGAHDINALSSLPSTITDTFAGATAPNTYTLADFNVVNYIRFNA